MSKEEKFSAVQLNEAQKAWQKLGYGMFIHFGVNTFSGSAWGDGQFPAKDFAPDKLNPRQWAEVAAEAGMKYGVLTAKHHDGFCLWPTQYSDYSVANSPGQQDVIALFVESFREVGIQTGLYYSLWDNHCPVYNDDYAYIDYMKNQLTELLNSYGPILEMWFDGAWVKDHPTRDWPFDTAWLENPECGYSSGTRWGWKEIYEHIHRLQPECLVIMNSSSDCPGKVKYGPMDIRTSEHYDFVWQDQICTPDKDYDAIPLEYCTTLTPDWFWSEKRTGFCHPSARTIADWYSRARAENNNLLLNIGPDKHGLIPEYHRTFLRQAANYFK